jgi:hypothetical protein
MVDVAASEKDDPTWQGGHVVWWCASMLPDRLTIERPRAPQFAASRYVSGANDGDMF